MSTDYKSLGDEQLVRLGQDEDRRAFDELVRRYQDKVYRLAYRILRNEDDAAETLQEAFLSAYRGLKKFKVESTFSTWLYRVATNAALMRYRRRREGHISIEQSQTVGDDVEPLTIPDWSTMPLNELLDRETKEVMEEGIERLAEELRTVFVLRDVEGLSNAEAAEVLDLSIPAVKSRLHRARLALRDRLSRYFADKLTRRDRQSR